MTLEDAVGLWLDLMWIAVGLLLGVAIGRFMENAYWNRALKSAGLQAVWHEESSTSGCTNWLEIVTKEVKK